VARNRYGTESIDFANPAAVKALNQALLKKFYDIAHWDIPPGYLCPPIPGRADYIHHVADLLAGEHEVAIPRGPSVAVLDIGIGANCVYPIVGCHDYGWQFVGTDIDVFAGDLPGHRRARRNLCAVDLQSALPRLPRRGGGRHPAKAAQPSPDISQSAPQQSYILCKRRFWPPYSKNIRAIDKTAWRFCF
jgi:hypothetical protein